MEKPVATDAPGVRRVLAAAEEAKRKNLNVCVGLQRRYQPSYQDMVKRIHGGEIGDMLYGRVYWNGTSRAGAERLPDETETALPDSQLVFLHLDLRRPHPRAARPQPRRGPLGDGRAAGAARVGRADGRCARPKVNGTIFDHHTVEFEYANGASVLSQCRQIGGKCTRDVSEHFHGTKGVGRSRRAAPAFLINGQPPGGKRQRIEEVGWQLEHDAFFENIRNGKVRNDAEYAAYSTLMGVMGRMATYTGQVITWEQAMNSKEVLVPDHLDWDTEPPVKPDADGWYPVAMPGTTRPV